MYMDSIKEALTYDDVLLIPKYSSVLPSSTQLSTELSKNLRLRIPFISSAMDTVTESKMAIAIAKEGGLGIIHRNLSLKKHSNEVKKVKNKKLIVGAAIGTTKQDLLRSRMLFDSGADLIVIDTAHGFSQRVIATLRELKKINMKIPICVGNIATGEAAVRLYNEGADILKIGIGPGSICTTRIVSGVGFPQLSAIINIKKSLKKRKIKLIADGGVKFSGDIAKGLAAGADAIMMGSIFSGTDEAPGKKFKLKGKLYKSYRGMGSAGAMMAGSFDRYFQKDEKDIKKFVPEGVEARVPYKGSIKNIIYQLVGGLRSSMGYIGAKNINELKKKGEFIKITKAGFYESMVHSVEKI